jgi:protein SCO1/2
MAAPALTGTLAATRVLTAGARYSDQLPDVECVTQSGRVVRLVSDLIRDRIVLVSFMYTQCNGTCPAASGLFQKLRAPLAAEFGDRVSLVSVTLDPLTDTPERLRQYAATFRAQSEQSSPPGLASWTFLTGAVEGVESIRRGFGYVDPDPVRDQDRSQHAALFTFGNDSTNRWSTYPAGLPFPQLLAAAVVSVTGGCLFRKPDGATEFCEVIDTDGIFLKPKPHQSAPRGFQCSVFFLCEAQPEIGRACPDCFFE